MWVQSIGAMAAVVLKKLLLVSSTSLPVWIVSV